MPQERSSSAGADDLRRMVLLLETADVLERRARRTADPAQVAVLLRRAEQRRKEADAVRERLAGQGAALDPERAARLVPQHRPRLLRPPPPAARPDPG